MEKIKIIRRALEETDCFIWSDCDVLFFGPMTKHLLLELGDYDIACQYDSRGMYCAGFFICRSSNSTKNLFRDIYEIMEKDHDTHDDDQDILNKLIANSNGKFLSDRFWTVGLYLENNGYSMPWANQTIEIPKDILVFHANWTIGIENKIKLLEMALNR